MQNSHWTFVRVQSVSVRGSGNVPPAAYDRLNLPHRRFHVGIVRVIDPAGLEIADGGEAPT